MKHRPNGYSVRNEGVST